MSPSRPSASDRRLGEVASFAPSIVLLMCFSVFSFVCIHLMQQKSQEQMGRELLFQCREIAWKVTPLLEAEGGLEAIRAQVRALAREQQHLYSVHVYSGEEASSLRLLAAAGDGVRGGQEVASIAGSFVRERVEPLLLGEQRLLRGIYPLYGEGNALQGVLCLVVEQAEFPAEPVWLGFGAIALGVSLLVYFIRQNLRIDRELNARLAVQQQLEEARETAESANRVKTRFLAAMSREVRAPLAPVVDLADILLAESDERIGDSLRLMRARAAGVVALIDDVETVARLEAGTLEVRCVRTSLAATLEEAVRRSREKALAKGVRFVLEVGPEVPDLLVFDALRFKQVVENLVSNAVKFTAHGEVCVQVAASERQPEGVSAEAMPTGVADAQRRLWLSVCVRDSGIGMGEGDQAGVFEPFSTGHRSYVDGDAGTGLGLALSRGLSVRMGGGIALESHRERGTLVRCWLPVGVEGEQGAQKPPHPG